MALICFELIFHVMSVPKRHHFHLKSILRRWSTEEANPILARPFDDPSFGQRRFGLLVVYDKHRGRQRGELARDVCAVDDLYTMPTMSALARGWHVAKGLSELERQKVLRDLKLGDTLAERLRALGAPELPPAARRRKYEVGVYGPIDSAASQVFDEMLREGVGRLGDEAGRSVLGYLRTLRSRTPWWRDESSSEEFERQWDMVMDSLPVLTDAFRDEVDAMKEELRSSIVYEAHASPLTEGLSAHIELIRPGYLAPKFVFGDSSGRPWGTVRLKGPGAVVTGRAPVRITYPISPQAALRVTGSRQEESAFTFEDRVASAQDVQEVNSALAMLARSHVVLPGVADQRSTEAA